MNERREREIGEIAGMIKEQAASLGFSRARILNPLPDLVPEGHTNEIHPAGARSALLVFLPYDRSEGEGTLAPFARSNYYRETVARLKKIVSSLRQKGEYVREDLRIFCNSRFPEKRMAWLCGLGTFGRNSLLITPEYGSLGIIGGIFLPFDLPGDPPLEDSPYGGCGSCRLCLDACPGSAVSEEGGIILSRCLQYLSTQHEVLPLPVMKKWHFLYGCQICQDVCPRNRRAPEGISLERGYLGAEPDLEQILNASEGELRELLKGTVLGQSWIEPVLMRRNALICLWNRSGPIKRRELFQMFQNHRESLLAETILSLNGS